ncbi:MAG: RNA polymerase sigma factor [Candidatus Krumholzibacteriia bacterium]
MAEENDAKLVAKSLRGNEKAFRALVERHQPMVYAAVRGVVGARDDVDDVVQDVFIKVYRALDRFRADAKFSSWVYRIARNEAIDAYRRTRHGGPSVEELDVAAPAAARPDEQFKREEHRQYLEIYVSRLDEDYRMVLELRYMGERSYADISELTGLPLGTVKSYLYRAKAELRRMMTGPSTGAAKDVRTP